LPPEEKKASLHVMLPPWLIAWLRAQDRPQSHLIEEALVKRFNPKKTDNEL